MSHSGNQTNSFVKQIENKNSSVFFLGGNHSGQDNEYQMLNNLTHEELKEFIKKNNIKTVLFEFWPSDEIKLSYKENMAFVRGKPVGFTGLFLDDSIQEQMSMDSRLMIKGLSKEEYKDSKLSEVKNFSQLIKVCDDNIDEAFAILKQIIVNDSLGNEKAFRCLGDNIGIQIELYKKLKAFNIDVGGIETVESLKKNSKDAGFDKLAENERLESLNIDGARIINDTIAKKSGNILCVIGNAHLVGKEPKPIQDLIEANTHIALLSNNVEVPSASRNNLIKNSTDLLAQKITCMTH